MRQTVCELCGKHVEETSQWYAFNIQKGYDKVFFDSRECLYSWVKKKERGMIIALVAGLALSVLLIGEMGAIGALSFFIPYTIRQLRSVLSDLVSSPGWIGEFISFMIVLLGGITIIYPLYKLIQELKEYQRIKASY